MGDVQDYGFFELVVEFKRESGDPSRVFKTMTGLIESFQSLDQHLSYSIGPSVKTTLILQDIQADSLKAKLKNVIEEVPDEALKQGEIKLILGHFIVKAKHKVIDWCYDRKKIEDQNDIKLLKADLKKLAQETDIKQIPAYTEPDTGSLLIDINSIRNSLQNLEANDYARYESEEGISKFNKQMEISEDIIKEIMTRERLISENEKILKVKKPDYLGLSMWSFKYQGKSIDVKILDQDWLKAFQLKEVSVLPGDSIRALVKEEVSYGYNNEVIHTNYEIIKVIEILPAPIQTQQKLLM